MSGGHVYSQCFSPARKDANVAERRRLFTTSCTLLILWSLVANFCTPVVTNKSAMKCAEKLNDGRPKRRKHTSRSFYIPQTLHISFKVIWFKDCGLFKLHLKRKKLIPR